MRESKAEPIKQIVKLVDAINHCSQLFGVAAETQADTVFQQFATKMRTKVEQFGFELRTELARLAAEVTPSYHRPERTLQASLELVMQSYRAALNTNLRAHARAMLTRQSEQMQKAYEEFVSIHRAA
jgi:hypothetical protein